MRRTLALLALAALSGSARADLAGICAAAGQSSDCVNKIQWGSQRPSHEPREPACDWECRKARWEWEQRIIASVPPAAITKPLAPDPRDLTDRHFARVSEEAEELSPALAGAMLLAIPAGAIAAEPVLIGAGVVLAVAWISQMRSFAVPGTISLSAARADTEECKAAMAEKGLACGGRWGFQPLPFRCDGVDSCVDALTHLHRARRCRDARQNVRDVCHKGSDDAKHQKPVDEVGKAVDKCRAKVGELCDCRPADEFRISKSAEQVCSGLGRCSYAASCASNVATLAATRWCRDAIDNLTALCPNASRSSLPDANPAEKDCIGAVAASCGGP